MLASEAHRVCSLTLRVAAEASDSEGVLQLLHQEEELHQVFQYRRLRYGSDRGRRCSADMVFLTLQPDSMLIQDIAKVLIPKTSF